MKKVKFSQITNKGLNQPHLLEKINNLPLFYKECKSFYLLEKLKGFVFLLCALGVLTARAQSPTFVKTYELKPFMACVEMPDESWTLVSRHFTGAGWTPRGIGLTRIDTNNNTLYSKNITLTQGSSNFTPEISQIQIYSNNTLVLRGGNTIIRSDDLGNIAWVKRYSPNLTPSSKVLFDTDEGIIIPTSNTTDQLTFMPSYKLLHFFKIDSTGNEIWKKMFSTSLDEGISISQIILGHDGNYVLSGSIFDISQGISIDSINIFVAKITTSGNLIWAKKYGLLSNGNPISMGNDVMIAKTNSSGYVVSDGFSFLSIGDNGNLLHFTHQQSSANRYSQLETLSNGNVLAYGTRQWFSTVHDMMALSLNHELKPQWARFFGLSSTASGFRTTNKITELSNGDLLIAATIRLTTITNNGMLMKTTPTGQTGCRSFGHAWKPSNILPQYGINEQTLNLTLQNSTEDITVSNITFSTVNSPPYNISSICADTISEYAWLEVANVPQTLDVGQNFNINWSAGNLNKVRIELSTDNQQTWTTLVNSVDAYTHGVSTQAPNTPSTQAYIRIISIDNPTVWDTTQQFEIVSHSNPFIVLSQPNGGEVLNPSGTYNIKWSQSGVDSVSIYFGWGQYIDFPGYPYVFIAKVPAANGEYIWNVPSTATDFGKIILQGPMGLSSQSAYFFSISGNNIPQAPAAPTNLTATTNKRSNGSIELNWQDNANNEDGFYVEYSQDTTSSSWTLLATLGVNEETYIHTGLNEGEQFFYRVSAFNSVGTSAFSNTAESTVSVNNNNQLFDKNNISIYPNPFKDKLIFEQKNQIENIQVEILDFQGKQLKYLQFSEKLKVADVSDLQNGIYFIKIIKNKEVNIEKSLKN